MNLSVHRFVAVLQKELIQARRDRFTLALMVGMPLVQLFLFGFAINTDPKHLPTALVMGDDSRVRRARWSSRCEPPSTSTSPSRSLRPRPSGRWPGATCSSCSRYRWTSPALMERRERPAVLLAADATDPTAVSSAFAAASGVGQGLLARDLPGAAAPASRRSSGVSTAATTPRASPPTTSCPGSSARSSPSPWWSSPPSPSPASASAGTMENLLAMPVRPLEVMLGKIVPYIFLGYVQVALILGAAVRRLSGADARLGARCSSWASGCSSPRTSRWASPSPPSPGTSCRRCRWRCSSSSPPSCSPGFMFPFAGMPGWARVLGEMLPAHPRAPAHPRHPPQGQRCARRAAAPPPPDALLGRGGHPRDSRLPTDARLDSVGQEHAADHRRPRRHLPRPPLGAGLDRRGRRGRVWSPLPGDAALRRTDVPAPLRVARSDGALGRAGRCYRDGRRWPGSGSRSPLVIYALAVPQPLMRRRGAPRACLCALRAGERLLLVALYGTLFSMAGAAAGS